MANMSKPNRIFI